MTMPVFASKQFDINFGILCHKALWPPAPFFLLSPATNVSIEMVTIMGWWPGIVFNQHMITSTVTHKNQGITQEGHDCGMLIPDLTIPVILNMLYPIQWLFSSRAVAFSCASVQANGFPVGLTQLIPPGPAPPLPMMTCGDPFSLPTGMPMNFMNRLIFGMSWKDLVAGLIMMAVSIAIDAIFFFMDAKAAKKAKAGKPKVPKKPKRLRKMVMKNKQIKKRVWKGAGKSMRDELVSNIIPTNKKAWKRWGIKTGVTSAAGVGTSWLQKDDPTLKVAPPGSNFVLGATPRVHFKSKEGRSPVTMRWNAGPYQGWEGWGDKDQSLGDAAWTPGGPRDKG